MRSRPHAWACHWGPVAGGRASELGERWGEGAPWRPRLHRAGCQGRVPHPRGARPSPAPLRSSLSRSPRPPGTVSGGRASPAFRWPPSLSQGWRHREGPGPPLGGRSPSLPWALGALSTRCTCDPSEGPVPSSALNSGQSRGRGVAGTGRSCPSSSGPGPSACGSDSPQALGSQGDTGPLRPGRAAGKGWGAPGPQRRHPLWPPGGLGTDPRPRAPQGAEAGSGVLRQSRSRHSHQQQLAGSDGVKPCARAPPP